MSGLVLSLFPGIGLLDMAFEEVGFCVVRGPDLLWGGDVRRFHPPAGLFDGVIGGPPCQAHTSLVHLIRHNGHEPKFGDMTPEFERVVEEAESVWFLMENVEGSPSPDIAGYAVRDEMVRDAWVGGETSRLRRFSFGQRGVSAPAFRVETLALSAPNPAAAVTGDMRVATNGERVRNKKIGGGGVRPHAGALAPFPEMLRLQGLPTDFLQHAPFTERGKRQAVGNGVPLPMGRAVAKAVKAALALGTPS